MIDDPTVTTPKVATKRRNVPSSRLPKLNFLNDPQTRWLAGSFLLALTLRMIVVALNYRDVAAPSLDHNLFGWEMGWTARSIALGRGFGSPFLPFTGPTGLVPPLYPYLLAAIFKIFGLYTTSAAFVTLALNALFSSLTCIPLYFITRNLFDTKDARIVSAAWALYPFAIYFSAARVWDYALTSLLFTLCLLAAQKLYLRRLGAWAIFGALYGVTALSNPSIVSLLPILLGISVYRVWRAKGAWFGKGLVASVAFFAMCLPWMVRSEQAMHTHFFLRDGFWLELYAGNHGDTSDSNPPAAHPASNDLEMRKYIQMGETSFLAEKHRLAVAWISQHPVDFAGLCVRRVVRFWFGFWSFSPTYVRQFPLDLPNIPFCLFLGYFMLRGVRRWRMANTGVVAPYLLVLLVFPLPYYLSHSSADYRQPIEPVILLLVCLGLFGRRSVFSPVEMSDETMESQAIVVQT